MQNGDINCVPCVIIYLAKSYSPFNTHIGHSPSEVSSGIPLSRVWLDPPCLVLPQPPLVTPILTLLWSKYWTGPGAQVTLRQGSWHMAGHLFRGRCEDQMTAAWRLPEGSAAHVLALLSGIHDSRGDCADLLGWGGRDPSTSSIRFPHLGLERVEGYPFGVCGPSGPGSMPLLLPGASWETASARVAKRAWRLLWVSKAVLVVGATWALGLHWGPQGKWKNQALTSLEPGQNPALSLIKKSA